MTRRDVTTSAENSAESTTVESISSAAEYDRLINSPTDSDGGVTDLSKSTSTSKDSEN